MMKSIINKLSKNLHLFVYLRKIIEFNFIYIEKILKKEINNRSKKIKILDIGCGSGEISRFFNNLDYIGIDVNPDYIEFARKIYKKNFEVMNAQKLRFKKRYFDYVVIIGVLHHIDDKNCNLILNEITRVIKDNGKIIIIEDVNTQSRIDLFGNLIRKLDVGEHIRTKKEWLELLSKKINIKKQYRFKSFIPTYEVFIS
jgi:ubiquinone/menaquinone biosynthesis C-methylase UbiE